SPPDYHCPKKLKNPKRKRKLKATDSNQFQNILPETQACDNVYSLSSEYIITTDPIFFPCFYEQFENTNPTILPSIFPKDDSYGNIINTHNDNVQQSLTEATASITYNQNIYPY
ncbi:10837_t:CDS:1, partial [Dentiscutata heterogama]